MIIDNMFKALILLIASTISGWWITFTNPYDPPVITPVAVEIASSTPESIQIPNISIHVPTPPPAPQESPNLTPETPKSTTTPTQPTYVPIIIQVTPPVGAAPEVSPPTVQSTSTTIIQQNIMPKPIKASLKILQMGGGSSDPANPMRFTANDYKINPDGTLAEGSIEPNDSNHIILGLVVRNDDGISVKNANVTITATDMSQMKLLESTGNIRKVYDADGKPETVHYYPFRYEFRTSGQHTITFSANGMTSEFKAIVE